MQMYMSSNEKLAELIRKAIIQTELLDKVPFGPTFYVEYSKYRELADHINKISKIESIDKNNQINLREGLFESFFGFITFRIVPTISLLEKYKKSIFNKLPENDTEYFDSLKGHFLKLAKKYGDRDFDFWLTETQKVFYDFLDQVETTDKGKEIFKKTSIMSVFEELSHLIKLNDMKKELETSSLRSIHENDIHSLVTKYKELIKNDDNEVSSLSLKYKGEIDLFNIYLDNGKTKEDLMTPVYLFQSKILSLEGLNTKNSKVQKPKFPYKIPAGTTWQNIYIQFKNPEVVTILVAGRTHETTFADMGFADKRDFTPNEQWLLFSILAKNNGSLSAGHPDAKDKYKKQKQLLSETLKSYFSLDADPFKTYGKKDGYSLKMGLSYQDVPKVEVNQSLESEIDDMFKDLTQ